MKCLAVFERPYGSSSSTKALPFLSTNPETHVDMHARAVDPFDRLRHERRVQPVLLGGRLQHRLERRRPVGGDDGIAVFEVDLMLAGSDLVVAGLDIDSHVPERLHHVLADGVGKVAGVVEVPRAVVGQRRDFVAVLSRTGRTPARDRS